MLSLLFACVCGSYFWHGESSVQYFSRHIIFTHGSISWHIPWHIFWSGKMSFQNSPEEERQKAMHDAVTWIMFLVHKGLWYETNVVWCITFNDRVGLGGYTPTPTHLCSVQGLNANSHYLTPRALEKYLISFENQGSTERHAIIVKCVF